jgi:putative glutamine amidotransferase
MQAGHAPKPLVLLPACNREWAGHAAHQVGRKYVEAARLAGALPLVMPWLEADEIDAALDAAHGVLLTGSPSNVHPSFFGEAVHNPALPLDRTRDDWVLPLVRRALQRGVPLLAICRGAQEVNVALGGSLHQAVQEVPGLADHRDDHDAPIVVQYGPAHPVHIVKGGVLEQLLGSTPVEVNSLHGQGVNRLAEGLRVEALAPDGLVEAFSVADAPAFSLCVQWHPEWQAAHNPVSMKLLRAFGDAVRQYRDKVRGPLPAQAAIA